MTHYVQSEKKVVDAHDMKLAKTTEQTSLVEQKKESSVGKKWADMVPVLLEGNLFDRFITAFRKTMTTLNLIDTVDNIVYWHGRHAMRVGFKALFDWRVYGASNFPEYGPVLLIANHQSVLDPFLIGSGIGREVRWMSKIQNFEMPIFKSILSFFGTFAVDREAAPTAVLDKAVEILNDGWCVGMFPEGTRSPDGNLAPRFKTGAARIILRAKCPYVPVAIIGSRDVLPKNSLKLKLNKVEIRVGEPVFLPDRLYESYTKDDIIEITKQMHEKVENLLNGYVDPKKKIVITPDKKEFQQKSLAEEYDLSIR